MKTIVLALTVLMLLISRAQGHDTKIRAYDIVGTIKYKHTIADNWSTLTTNTELTEHDMLQMPVRSSVLLMSENSHGRINSPKDSVVNVGKLLTEEDGFWKSLYATMMSYVSPKEQEKKSASISRGSYAMLFPADGELVNPGNLQFLWKKDEGSGENFVLKELTGTYRSVCNKNNVTDTSLFLPGKGQCPGLQRFEAARTYVWTVFAANTNDTKSNFISFTLADDETIEEVNKEMTQLNAKKSTMDARLYLLMAASVYEKHKMYTVANIRYRDAIAQYPASSFVIEAYNNFIGRITLMNQ